MEQVLAINNSLREARSFVDDTKFNKPYSALLSINISSDCEESVQGTPFTIASSHTAIDYIDEVCI